MKANSLRASSLLLALLTLPLAGCPPKTATTKVPVSGTEGAKPAKMDPAHTSDQELFRTAMLSKDSKERVRLLETLLARQSDSEAKEFVERQLVLAYAEAGEIEKMEKALADVTLESDDFQSVQIENAAAYAWAEAGVRLDDARRNVMAALSALDRWETERDHRSMRIPPAAMENEATFHAFIEENRAYFLDTLGWIEHRSGKNKEAVAVLEESARRTTHGTIQYHLGEAYKASGDPINAAKAYAKAAVEEDEESPKAKAALDELSKSGKVDAAPLLADAKKAHDARVAKEKEEQAAAEKHRAEELAAIAQHQRESARRGALDGRLDGVVPEFSIEDFSSKKLVKGDLDHQVTLIDFWASWCGPCKMEMPHLQTIFEKYKGKVRFLAISEDETKDDATDFMKSERYSFPVAFDESGTMGRSFNITGLPTLLVIGPCGKIAWQHRGFNPSIESVLTAQIDKLLAEESEKCEASK